MAGVNTTIWYDTCQSSRGVLVTIADLVCVGPAFYRHIDKLDKNNFYSVLHFEATYAKNAIFGGITEVSAPTDSECLYILISLNFRISMRIVCILFDITYSSPTMHPSLFPDSLKHADYPHIWSTLYPIDSSILIPTCWYTIAPSFCC